MLSALKTSADLVVREGAVVDLRVALRFSADDGTAAFAKAAASTLVSARPVRKLAHWLTASLASMVDCVSIHFCKVSVLPCALFMLKGQALPPGTRAFVYTTENCNVYQAHEMLRQIALCWEEVQHGL